MITILEETDSHQPLPLATCATLACLLEVMAPKPGNVHRSADFEDATFADFATSAAVVGPILAAARREGVGTAIVRAIQATRAAVGTNTNLGTVLLIAPLAAVRVGQPCSAGIGPILDSLGPADTADVYQAIRIASPGGLGSADEADVHLGEAPRRPLPDVMALAADRDAVARQFVNGFGDVFRVSASIERGANRGFALADAIVSAFLDLLASMPDTLISRKCGASIALEASDRAATVLQSGEPGTAAQSAALADFDFWLRSDGHRRNPGATADLIAAGLFVLLRENRLTRPLRFYR